MLWTVRGAITTTIGLNAGRTMAAIIELISSASLPSITVYSSPAICSHAALAIAASLMTSLHNIRNIRNINKHSQIRRKDITRPQTKQDKTRPKTIQDKT